MYFILSKILLFLIRPLIWVVFIFLRGIFTKDESKRKRRLIFGTLLLFVFSNGFLVNELLVRYESRGTEQLDSVYEVGIVLGGFATKDKRTGKTVFFDASDRLLQALELYHQGKIKRLLISSGSASVFNNSIKEADAVARYLKATNLPDSVIIVENQSRNTSENAIYSFRQLDSMNIKKGILVITSAWHLPRARLCFDNREGVHYLSTNSFGSDKRDYSPDNILVPSATALSKLEIMVKEWVGYAVYWVKE